MKSKDILDGAYTVRTDGTITVNYKDVINVTIFNGYPTIYFKSKTYYVHRLIAEAFIPNPHKYPCVNHINGDKQDNRVENLEWCTYSHNNREAYRIGLKKPYCGENCNGKPVVMLDDNKNEICTFKKMKYADKLFRKKTSSNIKRSIDTGTRAYGYYWRYL